MFLVRFVIRNNVKESNDPLILSVGPSVANDKYEVTLEGA